MLQGEPVGVVEGKLGRQRDVRSDTDALQLVPVTGSGRVLGLDQHMNVPWRHPGCVVAQAAGLRDRRLTSEDG
ncbi:hypothetical protein [Nonomuraea rubra]|uniref:hypothetical protein n=1 Tax=Nonomuraea rubra TaxID=46180 RepID=UPI0033E9CEB6